ncbi:MAG: IclR family transcriptional regulator [Candidatus Bipolaricaulota bacterium]
MTDAAGSGKSGVARVRSLDKALEVLRILAEYESWVDLQTLAQRAGLPKSTLSRLLSTLRAGNFVYQEPRTRQYRLGWSLVHLGEAAKRQFNLAQVLRPFLEQLARETGETASLAVLAGRHAVYIDQVVSHSIIKGVPPVGSALDLHCTAVGKMLLSSLPEETLEQLVREQGLPRRTERSIDNAARLRRELKKIREQGYAVDDEEAEPGGRCVAAPVVDGQGSVVAAVSITGPTSRITPERIPEYAEMVRHAAEQASALLSTRA